MSDNKAAPTIVIVDDEDIILTSLSSLIRMETDYNVMAYSDTGEALKYIENNAVSLVISDYLMPQMDGIAFLDKVKQIIPLVPRIMLTGYADKENVIKAINEIGLFQYIEKPWENTNLLIVMRNALEKQQLLSKLNRKIDEITEANSELLNLQKEIVKTFA